MTVPLLSYHAGRKAGDVVTVKLETLYETRLLIQGSSGAGKTQACFHLLEETHGHVQQIVVDKEGEFGKLAEKFDYLVIGGDGPQRIPLRKGALELQLTRVLELEISAIYDLSDLVPDQQRHVVARLARAMAHIPQRSGLWDRMRLALFDEMQWFAPQNGKAESLEPLIELASTGRKRGFCFVAAGTRVSMMAKSVTELLENKLIGRSGMNDAERAAKELEFDKHGRKELRSLPIGHFYAYGPAIAIDPILVQTPKELPVLPRRRGEHRPPAPAPSAKVKLVLEKFAGLEEEAEKKERTEEELRTELAAANRRIQQLQKGGAVVDRVVEKIVVDERAIARAVQAAVTPWERRHKRLTAAIGRAFDAAASVVDRVKEGQAIGAEVISAPERIEGAPAVSPSAVGPSVRAVGQSSRAPARPTATAASASAGDVAPGEQRILDALAELEAFGITPATRDQVGIFADYNMSGGTPGKYVGRLVEQQLVTIPKAGELALTDSGRAAARTPDVVPTRAALHRRALERLGDGERKILQHLLDVYPDEQTRAEVGAAVGYNMTGGTPGRYVGKLVTLRFAEIPSLGKLKAGKLLYPEGL